MKSRGSCIIKGCLNKGFHRLPKNKEVRNKWITAIKHHKTLFDNSSVCSEHFKDCDYIIQSVDGVPKRKLIKHATPSIFPWSEDMNKENINPETIKTYSRKELPLKFVEELPFIITSDVDEERDPLQIEPVPELETKHLPEPEAEPVPEHEIEPVPEPEAFVETECPQSNENYLEGIETISLHEESNRRIPFGDTYLKETNPPQEIVIHCAFSVHTYKHDDKAIHFYTGLESFDKFKFVFSTLGPDVNKLNYFYNYPPHNLSPLDQFFLTLIILRRHDGFQEMSNRFLITIKQVSNVFITWIRFMALQWQNIDLWPSRENIHYFAPLDFFDKYPLTRTVMDATEFPIKKPKLPLAQQITFSSYKNKNTVKTLIGISPSGLINYVSPCYGGSASDRQIIEKSEILNRFDYNDQIMVDKGLNVQDIFLGYGVKVNMPSFFKKRNQINPNTLHTDRKIASKRVHVERIIGMLKTYRILTQPMNKTETLLSSDITFICATFVNFRRGIISKNA